MLRWLLIGFLFAHGLVHVAIWAPKYDREKVAFDASHSWLIGDQLPLAQVLAFAAAASSSSPGSCCGRTAVGGGRTPSSG